MKDIHIHSQHPPFTPGVAYLAACGAPLVSSDHMPLTLYKQVVNGHVYEEEVLLPSERLCPCCVVIASVGGAR